MHQTNESRGATSRGQATALLVIDVQQGLFRKSTPIFRAEPLLDTITTLVERAHAAGVLVVYIQHASDKVLPFGSADWQLHPRLHPGEGDLVVHKQHGNAFEDTPLHTSWLSAASERHRDGPGDARLRQGDVRGALALGYCCLSLLFETTLSCPQSHGDGIAATVKRCILPSRSPGFSRQKWGLVEE